VAVYRSELACPYEPVSFFCDTEFALIVQELGYGSKIRNVNSSLVHKEILGLDVPVNAACRVHLFYRFKHLHSDVRYDVLEDFFGVLSLLDVVL
jgi:hypothetical protein